MKTFPGFMKRDENRIGAAQQNTPDVEGYYYTANDGSQAAFWTCFADRVSKEHRHDFDEYVLCVAGQLTVTMNGGEVVLNPGDELIIPAGTVQGGSCVAGTRTVHFFGGKRIK